MTPDQIEQARRIVESTAREECLFLHKRDFQGGTCGQENGTGHDCHVCRAKALIRELAGEEPPEPLYVWRNTDPRLSINKWDTIVIQRPSPEGRNQYLVGTARVETKHGWYIDTTFQDHPYIDADTEWNPDWRWIFSGTRK